MTTTDKINFRPVAFRWATNGLAIGALLHARKMSRRYLQRRGLDRPAVPWPAIKIARAEVRASLPRHQ